MQALSEDELETLAMQVEAEVNALYAAPEAFGADLKGTRRGSKKLPAAPKQQALIEQASGEDFASFWEKFRRHARQDLCQTGGRMHTVWKKYGDIDSKTAVKSIRDILLGMGLASHSIALLIVPVAVFMLLVLLKVGIEAVCEDCA